MQWLSLPACYHDVCLWPGSLSSPLHIKEVHNALLSLVPQGLQPLAPNHPTNAALKLVASAKHCSMPWNTETNISWCDWSRRKTQVQFTVYLHRQEDDKLHDTDIPCSYVTKVYYHMNKRCMFVWKMTRDHIPEEWIPHGQWYKFYELPYSQKLIRNKYGISSV